MSNETIFREVDDELRGDRMRALWRNFGPYVIGAAVLVVLVVAANEGWRWWQNSTAARSSDQFYAALELAEDGDVAGAQAALNEVIATGSGGYPSLARFRQAALLGQDGKTVEAVAAYDALATAETDRHLRELALVLAANLLVDSGDVAAVQQRVGSLAVPGGAMRNAAREAIGLTQYQAGDLNAALATFGEIVADPLAGNDLLGRVQIYIAQLRAMGALTPEEQAEKAANVSVVVDSDEPEVQVPVAPSAQPPAPVAETPAPVAESPAMAPAEEPSMAPAAEPAAPAMEAPAAEPAAPEAMPAPETPAQPATPAPAETPVAQPAATAN